jgi:hypothetical protein
MQLETGSRSSWFSKFFEILLVYIALVNSAYMLLTSFAGQSFYVEYGQILNTVFVDSMFVAALLALVYAIYWHRNGRKKQINSAVKHAWLRAVIRYFIAYTISIYGFAKICRTQFTHAYFKNDIPAGHLSGIELTWYYFGHSYTFAVILGCIQIGGGILLMFRRTTLLGTCVLLPVMSNILLINLFYDIAVGAFIVAGVLTIGLLYLLLLRWRDLKALFWNKPVTDPPIKLSVLKPMVLPLVLLIAFYSVYHYVAGRPPSAPFTGVWKVSELKWNGKADSENAWINKPSSFHKIYIEEGGTVSFSANPYAFDEMKAWFAGYQYDARHNKLNVFFNGPTGDTTKVAISNYTGKAMQWNAVINKDTLQMKLYKE